MKVKILTDYNGGRLEESYRKFIEDSRDKIDIISEDSHSSCGNSHYVTLVIRYKDKEASKPIETINEKLTKEDFKGIYTVLQQISKGKKVYNSLEFYDKLEGIKSKISKLII